jgi:hypothetical protein
MVVTSVIGATGCGGGGGGSQSGMSGGGLTAQVLWQQPGQGSVTTGAEAQTGPCPIGAAPIDPSGFGTVPPLAVRTIRIQIDPSEGASCCVALPAAPFRQLPGERRVVILNLPAGRVTTTLAGFATDFASNDGVKTTCAVDGPVVDGEPLASPCDPRRATPSFLSSPKDTTIVPGETTDAGPLFVSAVPFVLQGEGTASLQPEPDGTLPQNAPVCFSVVNASNAPSPVTLEPTGVGEDGATPVETTTVNLNFGELAAGGLRVSGVPAAPLALGSSQITIRAVNDQGCPVDFTYPFTVVAPTSPVPQCPTPVGTPTLSPTATPTPTLTPTPTPTPTCIPGGSACRLGAQPCCTGFDCRSDVDEPFLCLACLSDGADCNSDSLPCCTGSSCQVVGEFVSDQCRPCAATGQSCADMECCNDNDVCNGNNICGPPPCLSDGASCSFGGIPCCAGLACQVVSTFPPNNNECGPVAQTQ